MILLYLRIKKDQKGSKRSVTKKTYINCVSEVYIKKYEINDINDIG